MSAGAACKRIFTVRNDRATSTTVHCAWQKSPGGLLASSVEGSPLVLIHERQGKIVEKLAIPASCVGLSWDEDGDILAIIVDHPGVLLLWEVHSSRLQEIDTGMKDIGSCVAWSKVGKILCFASQKGNILIYNHRNLRRIPIIGKHSKRIVCVEWSNDTLLALGTTDNFLSVNTMDGDTIKNFQLRGKPSDLQFGHIKEDRNASTVDNTVSAIVGEKTLYLLKFDDGQGPLTPMELGFQARYGNLVTHHWHGDGYILVSFSAGFIVLLSSHYKEIGTELVLCELKADPLRHACLNIKLSRLAVCFGDSLIQIHDATDPKAVVNTTDTSDEDGRVRPALKCFWTGDGQLLAVVNTSGDVGVFLTSVPMLGSYNWNQVAAMSSLTDVVLYGFNEGQLVQEFTYNLDFEPSLIVLGPYYLAACLNNKAWFYPCQDFHSPPSNQAVATKEFNSNIQELVVNADYCAARCGDRAYLVQIEGDGVDLRGMKTFPEQQSSSRSFKVTCLCMTKDVFLFGADNGMVRVFHLDSWCEIIQLQSPAGVALKSIHANFNGIFFVLIDKHCQGFFYNIDEDGMKPIPNFPTRCDGVLWDTEYGSRHIFLAYSLQSTKIQVYVTWRQVLLGEGLHQVGTFQWFQTSEHRPLCFRKGVIASMTSSGRVIRTQCVYLDKPEAVDGNELPDGKLSKLNRLLVMKKFPDAYDYCLVSKDEDMYLALGRACLESMELDVAMKAYVAVNDIGMVYSIRRAMKNKDFNQCSGNVAVILGEFDLAEQKYLEAGLRIPALQMRRDLQEWDKALEMAQKFAPHLVADVSREFALYHEHNGEYAVALTLFEEAFNKFGDASRGPPRPRPITAGGRALSSQLADGRVLKQIEEGIARNSIRCGHIQKGFQMAIDSSSAQHKKDCAAILESSKSYGEAGALYEDCKLWENAASCYIRMKNWNRVADLLQYIQSPKIFVQFGKAKETEGKLREAAISYEKANDVMNSIRLYLSADYPDDAIRVARVSGSLSGAMLVSRYFEEHGDMETALRFLIISRCYEDALLVAFKHGKAETYVQCIEDEFPTVPAEFLDGIRQVAAYFEEKRDNFKAGKYYQSCGDYKKSFALLMKAAQNRVTVDDNELMEVVIQTVIKSENEAYSRALVEFLLGEKDGVPKDPKFLLSYYISANRLVEASKTAVIVAMEDQKGGNYKDAHATLVRTCKELKSHSMKIPKDIMDALKILHYYLLVRKHVNIQNHKQAARLLVLLVDNISKFPTHAVQLLTTAAVECQKAGLRQSSMQCCFTLMKPEYRKQIADKFKAKIETMVRKSGKSKLEDAPDDMSPCPFCQTMLPDYTLVCAECKSEIPFCIASGRHIFSGDFTTCPNCEFPAVRSELLKLLESEPVCPLCSESLSMSDVNLINDLHPYLFVTRTG